jgi:hypothetical protein
MSNGEIRRGGQLMKFELTASQCRNLAEFVETNLIDYIRNDPDLDNVSYLRDMIGAIDVLAEAYKAETGVEVRLYYGHDEHEEDLNAIHT